MSDVTVAVASSSVSLAERARTVAWSRWKASPGGSCTRTPTGRMLQGGMDAVCVRGWLNASFHNVVVKAALGTSSQ